jgi:hypothetical protein
MYVMLYTSPWSRWELTPSVVIGTDCIGSCKSNHHMITATTARLTGIAVCWTKNTLINKTQSVVLERHTSTPLYVMSGVPICIPQVLLFLAYINDQGPSWPWSYGGWIYNYLCNQCLSPLMVWVLISIRAWCTTLHTCQLYRFTR